MIFSLRSIVATENQSTGAGVVFLTASTGAIIKVKGWETGYKLLGCMLSAAGSKNATLDTNYYLQYASPAFVANKLIFLSRNVSIRNRLKCSEAIFTPITCFGVGPGCIHKADVVKLDFHFRRMIRSVVHLPLPGREAT